MSGGAGADRDQWLCDLLLDKIQFYVWGDAKAEDVRQLIGSLSDSDEFDGHVAALVRMPKWCCQSEAQLAVDEALEGLEGGSLRQAIRQQIINAPETADFMAGVPIEADHQRSRWGSDHDAGKSPFDWFWLIGYLAQKAATSAVAGNIEKARHHTISTAAALANWHAALSGADSSMRPGINPPLDLDNLPLANVLNQPFPTPSRPKGSSA